LIDDLRVEVVADDRIQPGAWREEPHEVDAVDLAVGGEERQPRRRRVSLTDT
jgi:hypothetical protein